MTRNLSTDRALRKLGAVTLTCALPHVACEGWTWREDGPRPPADGAPFALKILTTQECPRTTELGEGNRLLGVEVELTGWADAGVPANFYYARLEDSEGRSYESLEGCDPLLAGPPLRPGEQARGYLTFVVPTTDRSYTLVYAPRLWGAAAEAEGAQIALPLRAHD